VAGPRSIPEAVFMASFFFTSDAGSLRRTWIPLVGWGAVIAAFGIVVAVWPSLTSNVFVSLFGLASIVAGLVWMSWIVSVRSEAGSWWIAAFIPGALLLLFGGYALTQPQALIGFLLKAVALVAVLIGLADMVASWRLRSFFFQWWMRLLRGLLVAGAGVIVFLQPETGVLTAGLFIGLIFIAIGAMTIWLGLAARRLPKAAGAVIIDDRHEKGRDTLPPA
jgi:uncharacterized membrane protein HdeD (DUF308 family)